MSKTYNTFTQLAGCERRSFALKGRVAWALLKLIEAGNRGITTLETLGPRLSAYVHSLRKLGIEIETQYEPHDGPFLGNHARYVLKSTVVIGGQK